MKPKTQIQARVHSDLVMRIDSSADANHRSRTGEIEAALEWYFKSGASGSAASFAGVACHQQSGSFAEVACHPQSN